MKKLVLKYSQLYNILGGLSLGFHLLVFLNISDRKYAGTYRIKTRFNRM